MNTNRVATIVRTAALAVVAVGAGSSAATADIFTDFSLVVRQSLDSTSQVGGRTAVGGNLTGPASNYGTSLNSASAYRGVDVLTVGGSILSQNINMQAGNVRLGGTLSGRINHNGGGSTIYDPSAASTVADLGLEMDQASFSFRHLEATNTVVLPSGQPRGVTFNAIPGADGVAVFNIAGPLFSNNLIQQLDLNLNGATTVVINVAGSSINWTDGNMVGGLTTAEARSRVLWNFYEASNINLGGRSMNGAVLAPLASVSFQGTMQGSMWVDSLTQRASISMIPYTGAIPAPGSVALLAAAGLCVARRRR